MLHRSPAGVTLTPAGAALYGEARTLLERADQARARVAAAAGTATISIGTLADSAAQVGTRLVTAYRQRHPAVDVRIREADLTDPTTGLRTGLVDLALTRAPFDDTGITMHVLRADPVGVVLRTDDPLAHRDALRLRELADRRWFRFPDGTDPIWHSYWNRGTPPGQHRDGPVVRTVHECLQAVLWNGTVGLTPLPHAMPEGLISVPLLDMPLSHLVIAWNSGHTNPLIHSFIQIAAAVYRPASSSNVNT